MTFQTYLVVCAFSALQAFVHGETRLVYSIGDLHGDFDRFRTILTRIGLATFDGDQATWTGGNSVLVSTGDSVDRGERARPIYLTFQALAAQAPEHGGEVVNVIGNHELMNLQGDLRYVPESEFKPNGEYGGPTERKKEWGTKGRIGADIRQRFHTVAMREGTVFVHGGLDPIILDRYTGSGDKRLINLNEEVRGLLNVEKVPFNHKLFGDKGPFWNRFLAEGPEAAACQKVQQVLDVLGAKRMVLGHTPQMEGVNTRCNGSHGPALILADTVISRAYEPAFGFSRPSAVEYNGNKVSALYFPDSEKEVQRVMLSARSNEL